MQIREFQEQLKNCPDAYRFFLAFFIFWLLVGGSMFVMTKQAEKAEQFIFDTMDLGDQTQLIIWQAELSTQQTRETIPLTQQVAALKQQWNRLADRNFISLSNKKQVDALIAELARQAATTDKTSPSTTIADNGKALLKVWKQIAIDRSYSERQLPVIIAFLSWLAMFISAFGYVRIKQRMESANNPQPRRPSVERL